jgi:DNA-binding Lrp family transcriptional regulator
MSPQTPDQAVLESAFLEFKNQEFPDATLGDAFEHFCGQELTKEFGLSDNEVKKGVIGGDKDGGIDGFYVIVNENEVLDIDSPLVTGDTKAIKALPRNFVVDVVVIQAKWTEGWQADPLTRVRDTLERTIKSNPDVAQLGLTLNSSIIERTGLFRDLYQNTLNKGPKYRFHIYYATKAPDENLVDNHDARAKADALEGAVKKLLPSSATAEVKLLGARAMCDVLFSTPSTTSTLRFTGTFVRDEKSYVGLVSLRDYLTFIRQEDGEELRPGIFESNVRDYAGDKGTVNSSIKDTVTSGDGPTFWWLNNGVTVLCDVAEDAPPLSILLTNPLVVNGLQTSNVIHEAEREGAIPENRLKQGLMVRIIATSDDEVRDGVIGSTNRQNSIPQTQLHATEQQHRDIEAYFATQGWYYERRKHQYRGAGKPASRVVKMTDLTQYMIAIALGRPDDARARPQSVIGDNAIYAAIFGANVDRTIYLAAVRLMSQVDSFLRSDDAKAVFDDFTNARFYVAIGYVMKTLRTYTPANLHWDNNHHRIPSKPNQARLLSMITTLQKTYQDYQDENPNATRDQIFKGKALKDRFFADLKA